MKPALVEKLFERPECFVHWSTVASRRFENQADRADGREPTDMHASARTLWLLSHPIGERLWRVLNDLGPDLLDHVNARWRKPHDRHPIQ